MKISIVYFLSFLLAFLPAYGAFPPTTIKGQSDTGKPTTFNVQVPYNQATRVGSTDALIESGNENLLKNPNFEAQSVSTSWTLGTGVTVAATSTAVRQGKQAAVLTLPATLQTVMSQSTTANPDLSGISVEYSIWTKTTMTDISVCALQAGAVVGVCLPVISTGLWTKAYLSLPGTSGTQGLSVIKTTGTGTGTVSTDQAYVGQDRNIGSVSQATFFGGAQQDGAANCNYAQSTSSGENNYVDLGLAASCAQAWTSQGNCTAVGPTSHQITCANMPPGDYKFEVSASFFGATSGNTYNFKFSDGTNQFGYKDLFSGGTGGMATSEMLGRITYTNTATRTFKIQGSNGTMVGSSGQIANQVAGRSFIWRIWRFPTSDETVVNLSSLNWKVDANISGANPSLGASTQSSYIGIENSTLTLTNNPGNGNIAAQIPCSGANAPTGTTCAVGNESVGVSFNVPRAGDVLACASFSHNPGNGVGTSIDAAFQIVETPNNAQTISQEGKSRIASANNTQSSAFNFPLRVCGNFTFSSNGQKTLRLMYEQQITGSPPTNLILADAAGAAGQRDIHWEVYPINFLQNLPVIVSGGDIVRSNPGSNVTPGASLSYVNITSISLPAGEWDVSGNIVLNPGTMTGGNLIYGGISTSSGTFDSTNNGGFIQIPLTVNQTIFIPVGTRRLVLGSTTTVYLIGALQYSTLGTASFTTDNIIRAVRVR